MCIQTQFRVVVVCFYLARALTPFTFTNGSTLRQLISIQVRFTSNFFFLLLLLTLVSARLTLSFGAEIMDVWIFCCLPKWKHSHTSNESTKSTNTELHTSPMKRTNKPNPCYRVSSGTGANTNKQIFICVYETDIVSHS